MNMEFFKTKFFYVFLLIIFVLISINANMLQTSGSVEAKSDYAQSVDSLAQNVGFASDLPTFLNEATTPTVVYNFVVVVRFLSEEDCLSEEFETLGITYYQTLEQMYNSQTNYSVNKYYKTISNGLLDLQTVFVTQNQSLVLEQTRSEMVNENRIGNTVDGYNPNTMEKYYLEYELLAQVYDYAIDNTISTEYPEIADYNSDGKIDSLSIIYLPQPSYETQVVVDWGDLLWAHASEVQTYMIQAYGYMLDISMEDFSYTYGENTYVAGNYMLTPFEKKLSSVTGMPKNTTHIHELGHVLGWPDYYIYDTTFNNTASDDTEPVFVWDIMAYNHLSMAQYPTTYSRAVQNWLPSSAVVEITQNGEYTLKPVSYEEISNTTYDGRPIAYKITNPDNPNQSIWFEFRFQKSGTFESNGNLVLDGLLVYRVDEGFAPVSSLAMSNIKNAGNFAAAPYNLYVFRNEIEGDYDNQLKVQFAPLDNVNSSMGDKAQRGIYTATDITWQIYNATEQTAQNEINNSDVSYVDSGIQVNIMSYDTSNYEITFQITYDEFTKVPVERSAFADTRLYNRLLEIAGRNLTDTLDINDFQDFTQLDLSNLGISNLQGLEQFNLPSLLAINLNFNNFNTLTSIETVNSLYPNVKFSLAFNKFNLEILSVQVLNDDSYLWAFQSNLYDNDSYLFNNLTMIRPFFWKSSYNEYFSLKINNILISNNITTMQYYSFDSYGEYSILIEPITSGGFFQREINVVKHTNIHVVVPDTEIERLSDFPELIIDGILKEKLQVTRTPTNISTATKQNNFLVTWQVLVIANNNVRVTVQDYFSIIDTQPPIITLSSTDVLQLILGQNLSEILPETEITITDNGESVNYPFITNPVLADNNYWSKHYFSYSGGTYTQIENFENVTFGKYAIGYYAKDETNQTNYIYRFVDILGEEIDEDSFVDSLLYDAIIAVSPLQTEKVYTNSLQGLSYIDLSNKNISNLSGLENLQFDMNVFIDLSFNNLSNIEQVNIVLQNGNISIINLMFNEIFPDEQVVLNEKMILGFQGRLEEIYLSNMMIENQILSHPTFYNYDDYQNYYEQVSIFPAGLIEIINWGEYEILLNSTGLFANISMQFVFGNVDLTNDYVAYDVFDDVNLFSLVISEVICEEDYALIFSENDMVFDAQNKDFSNVGNYNIKIDVVANDKVLKTLNLQIEIEDNVSPSIYLSGDNEIYQLLGQIYIDFGVLADDNYDSNLVIETLGVVNINQVGKYTISYTARDQSGNLSQTVNRNVYVGNITPKANYKVDVYNWVDETEMFLYDYFTLDDFSVPEIVLSYDKDSLGEYLVTIKFSIKNDESYYFILQNTVEVVDEIAPTIQLIGEDVVFLFVDSIYTESGAISQDNYDEPQVVSNITGSINTGVVGEYFIYYNAQDSQGNIAQQATRQVHILPKPFEPLKINLKSGTSSLFLGSNVRVEINLDEYDEEKFDFESTFIWIVDGEEVKRGSETFCNVTFEKIGTHIMEVKVINQIGSNSQVVDGVEFQVSIVKGNFIQKYGLYVIIGSVTTIILLFCILFIARKRRKFYF